MDTDAIPLAFLASLFTVGALLHNAEEALYLPAWSEHAGQRKYMPGTATALLLNLPLGLLYLHKALDARFIEMRTFSWAGPTVAIGLLLLMPLLFALGRRFQAVSASPRVRG